MLEVENLILQSPVTNYSPFYTNHARSKQWHITQVLESIKWRPNSVYSNIHDYVRKNTVVSLTTVKTRDPENNQKSTSMILFTWQQNITNPSFTFSRLGTKMHDTF